MRLTESDAWDLLLRATNGVLGTVGPNGDVNLVPVVYAVDGVQRILVPIDRVKAKTTIRLQRLENVRSDPRCSLLVQHYEDDWSRLWWVRVTGMGREASDAEIAIFRPLLMERYPEYERLDAIAGGLLIEEITVTGWQAE